MRQRILRIHPLDNVIVALDQLNAGEEVQLNDETYQLKQAIPPKHKFAQVDFQPGDTIKMYGVRVGKAALPIQRGEAITTQNIHHDAETYGLREQQYQWQPPKVDQWKEATFMGYHRSDGKVGVANYWLVIPLVFCENRNLQVMREALVKELGYDRSQSHHFNVRSLVQQYQQGTSADALLQAPIILSAEESDQQRTFPHVDGIQFLTHEGGCGGTRQDAQTLCALFAGYITHANVAGATVLSLGCQNAEDQILLNEIRKRDPNFDKPLHILEQQQSASERDFIAEAIKKTFVGLAQANQIERKPAPLSKLVVGLECGGSDGFSGISANPSVGHAADLLVALGGSVVLSEFPELCGVEQELTDRCADRETAEKFIRLMRAYSRSAEAVGSGFDMNPSPALS